MLAIKSSVRLSRPQQARPASRARCVVVRAQSTPAVDINKKVEEAVKAAEDCSKQPGQDCAVAWDTVEELSAAASHKKVAAVESSDPLEEYCKDAPDADECRVYDQ